jgi:hypothetical protein
MHFPDCLSDSESKLNRADQEWQNIERIPPDGVSERAMDSVIRK